MLLWKEYFRFIFLDKSPAAWRMAQEREIVKLQSGNCPVRGELFNEGNKMGSRDNFELQN